jgi:hypothetical protein
MIHIPDRVLSGSRSQDELAEAWDHLANAAEHTRETSRRRARVARDRLLLASRALRGEPPSPPVRWLAIGLAAGAAIGAAGALALARRQRDIHQDAADITGAEAGDGDQADAATMIRAKAGAAAEAVREGASVAIHNAATAAREAASNVLDKIPVPHRGPATEPAPPEAPGSPGPAAAPEPGGERPNTSTG